MKKMFTLGAIALTMFSCRKETPITSLENKNPGKLQQMETMVSMDANLDFVAKHLAASLYQKEMRYFIKTEALKKFDGDYDILFDMVKLQYIKGKSFQNQLATDQSTTIENAITLNNINFIAKSLPLLNISVPVNIDSWDAETFTPLVAIIASDYDEKKSKEIKAYDVNGKIHWLDPKKMPEFPVIAIGINERTVINSLSKAELKKGYASSTKKSSSPQIMDLIEDDGSGGGGGTISICRINGEHEYLDGITFPGSSLQNYEDWLLGAPELRVTIFKPINNFTELGPFYNTYYEPQYRGDVNGVWDRFYGQWHLFQWENATYGNTVIYQWIEEDSGSIIKFDVNATISGVGLKATIDIHNDDDPIATVPVEQSDCRGTKIYGGIEFQFELKHQAY